MQVLENATESKGEQQVPKHPVMNCCWAEAVIDLRRANSRLRHPSNQEATWEKDGAFEPTEWIV